MINRRQFAGAAAAFTLAGQLKSAPDSHGFVKSICSVIFPPGKPVVDFFPAVKSAGFDGVELRLGDDIKIDATADDLAKIRDASKTSGVAIASIWVSEPLSAAPLNHPSAEVRAKGVAAIQRACEIAGEVGCGALLLYPGRLGSGPRFDVGYEATWERFTAELKKCLPAAEKHKVLLTPENVWNKFLVSPLEMRAFIDQFHSPWMRSHFDIGNVMQFGYPQDWILTLGPRIARVHVKDYKLSGRAEQGRFVDLLQGDVNWKEVMAALVKVGYKGFLSPEISYDRNATDQLKTVSKQLDTILAMGVGLA
jgi:hexulose-6-phosphate isomerase